MKASGQYDGYGLGSVKALTNIDQIERWSWWGALAVNMAASTYSHDGGNLLNYDSDGNTILSPNGKLL